MSTRTRREVLGAGIFVGGTLLARPLEALVSRLAEGSRLDTPGYGALAPVNDGTTGLPLLQLPSGFRYLTGGWRGDPLDNGFPTPSAHDGMAAFPYRGTRIRLVRNHEVTTGPLFAASGVYDSGGGGGTTTLEFDVEEGRFTAAFGSLSGTVRNCAGGATPWGTWLTCEESLLDSAHQPLQHRHGYVFEVPIDGEAGGVALTGLGRFVHEAVAVDPASGIVYETEDQDEAGLYRFTPGVPGHLAAGGRLEMLAIEGRRRFDLRGRQPAGVRYPVTWVPINRPDPRSGPGVFAQGRDRGGATFARLEGACESGGRIYVTSTSGGAAKCGQVWEFDPAAQELRLVFESPSRDLLDMPDNVCPSPRGGLVLCEDNSSHPSVHGLTTDGRVFRFARNNVILAGHPRVADGDYRNGEFAGATFSPDGRWLFVNVQRPGFTAAITGPWEQGLI